jgi:uncharacterized Zn-binding protein involved in type VI secretion
VQGQGNVFVNGRLWAVQGDPNTHINGNLIPVTGHTVFINGKQVIVAVGDTASVDLAGHSPPEVNPLGHSGDVFAYGG